MYEIGNRVGAILSANATAEEVGAYNCPRMAGR